MQAKTAADIFQDWAVAEGLMPEGVSRGGHAHEFALIAPATDEGRQILRSKQVQAIAFNTPAAEIVVFMRRAMPTSKKALARLPSAVDDVVIKYRQGVQTPIGGLPSQPFGGPAYTVRSAQGLQRYTCGSSISVGNVRDAGTLGALVHDAAGVVFGLSNNHVSGSCSFAGVGMPIVAPGVYDVAPNSLAPFTIGYHFNALPLVAGSADNVDPAINLDAAIFRIANPAQLTSFQGDAFDTPSAVMPMVGGMVVEKYGRTTGLTTGTVAGQFNDAHPIRYAASHYDFSGSVSFDPAFAIVGMGDVFSDHGDSGSLITTVDAAGNRFAVGIVVGGMTDGAAPGGKITIALPIGPILAGLGVSLVSNHNV
jgi:hypothetical protein